MKIIVRDEQGIKKCFIQIRDVKYLDERFKMKKFTEAILGNAIFRDLKDEEFFEVKNKGIAEFIDRCDYIVDFSSMVTLDGASLSRMSLLSQISLSSEQVKKDAAHKAQDLSDIISFNNGTLHYQIPVLYDDKIKTSRDDVIFGSTTIPGYYMLASRDKNCDLSEYLEEHAYELFDVVNGEEELESYNTIKVGSELLVKFKVKKNILAKIKKRITF